jgi:hypothetical protein
VTNDGRLWHAVRDGGTSAWTPFGDVGAQAGNSGRFIKVDCASEGSQLHVVAITEPGQILYTIRGVNSWRPFEDVVAAATVGNGLPTQELRAWNVSVAFCNGGLPSGQWQLNIVASTLMSAPRLAYTIHSSQPVAWDQLPQGGASLWKPWANLLDETGGGGEGGEFGNEYSSFSVAQSQVR